MHASETPTTEHSFSSSDTVVEVGGGSDDLHEKPETSTSHADRSTAFLDGLRGLAALSVFIQHYIPGFDLQVHEHGFGQLDDDGTKRHYYIAGLPFVRTFFNGGNAAVAVFFVLSGYVLSKGPLRLLLDGRPTACGTSLLSAFVRRPLRLYLPIFAVSLLTALAAHVPGPLMEISVFAPPTPTVWKEVQYWFKETRRFFNPFKEHDSTTMPYYYNVVAWTLPIELKGSVFVYVLVALFAFTGARPGLTVIGLFIFSTILLQIAWWAWACFGLGLVLGIVDIYSIDLKLLEQHLTPRARSLLYHFCFWAGWYLLSQPAVGSKPAYSLNTPGWHTLTLLTPHIYDIRNYYRYWESWGAFLLVYATLRLAWLQNFLNRRSLRYLGKVSFMLYLVHLPLNKIFGDRLSKAIVTPMPFGWDEPERTGPWYDRLIRVPEFGPTAMDTRVVVCMGLNLLVTLLVAHAATVWIDLPTVRLGKKLAHKLGLDVRNTQEMQGGAPLLRWTYQQAHS